MKLMVGRVAGLRRAADELGGALSLLESVELPSPTVNVPDALKGGVQFSAKGV